MSKISLLAQPVWQNDCISYKTDIEDIFLIRCYINVIFTRIKGLISEILMIDCQQSLIKANPSFYFPCKHTKSIFLCGKAQSKNS